MTDRVKKQHGKEVMGVGGRGRRFHIGLRILKTAVAVYVCFLIYLLRGQRGIPFYSAIAAILCMQPYVENSGRVALDRIIGTLIGAFYGTILVYLFFLGIIGRHGLYLMIALAVIPVIETSVVLRKPQVAYFSCVVFLSITANHITDVQPYIFVLDRVMDTFIGIGVSLVVNLMHIPRYRKNDVLFVSGLDDTLLKKDGQLSSYSKIELNRMLRAGALFTIATERTPAALLEPLKDIELKLPVVAMSGAALYDVKEHRYIKKCMIDAGTSQKILDTLDEAGVGYFVNSVIHDVRLIYIDDFTHENLQDMYRRLRRSPHRNYIYTRLPKEQEATYFYIMDSAEKIEALEETLRGQDYFEKIRLVSGDEKYYEGYKYMKIYSRQAGRERMIEELKESLKASEVVSFGSIEGEYDVVIGENNDNAAIRAMKRLYEPYFWEKFRKNSGD